MYCCLFLGNCQSRLIFEQKNRADKKKGPMAMPSTPNSDSQRERRLALTSLKTLVHFVDNVETTATANDLIVAMPGAQRSNGIFDFHSGHPSHS